MQISPELPAWISPALTAIGGIITGLITGVVTYRTQSKQLKNDWQKAEAEMKKAGTDEFEAINAGNKALREALMLQIKTAHQDYDRLKTEYDKCEEKYASDREMFWKRIRRLENKMRESGITVVYFDEESEENESSAYRRR